MTNDERLDRLKAIRDDYGTWQNDRTTIGWAVKEIERLREDDCKSLAILNDYVVGGKTLAGRLQMALDGLKATREAEIERLTVEVDRLQAIEAAARAVVEWHKQWPCCASEQFIGFIYKLAGVLGESKP